MKGEGNPMRTQWKEMGTQWEERGKLWDYGPRHVKCIGKKLSFEWQFTIKDGNQNSKRRREILKRAN